MPPPFEDVVSPELALVDPELAARARATLPAPAAARRALVSHASELGTPPSLPRARRRIATPAVTLLATAAASLIVTAFTGPGSASGESQAGTTQQSQPDVTPIAASSADTSASTTQSTPQASADVDAPAAYGTHGAPVEGGVEPAAPTVAGPRTARGSVPAPRVPMSAPTLVWRPSAAATSYDLELVRDGSVIHSQRLRSPRVVLPRRWQRAGVTYSIRPEDETFVWPVVGGRRSTVPLVNGVLALDLTPVARYVARSRSNGQQP